MDHHASIPTPDQIGGLIAEAHQILDELERGIRLGERRTPNLVELLARDRDARRDGYPASTLGGSGGSSAPDGAVAGAVVSNLMTRDPVHYQAQTALRGLTGALGDLRMSRDSLSKAFSRPDDLQPGDPACSNHARHGLFEIAEDNGRCRWCYDFWLAQGVDAPFDLIDARSKGKRITFAMVDAALRPSTKKRRSRLSRLSR